MQFCTKCKNICEDKLTSCPNCKRSKCLREVKDEDMVFFDRLGEVDAYEISVLLEENAIKYELLPIPLNLSTSIYDATQSQSDKNLFIEYINIDNAKQIINDYYFSSSESLGEDKPPEDENNVKNIFKSSAFIITFMILVGVTVFFADAIANFLRSLF